MTAKRISCLLPIVALLVLGMGDLGLNDQGVPPWPDRNFTGDVTDRSMVTLHVTHINCEGKTSVNAYMGEIRVNLSFDDIKQIDFYPGTAKLSWGNVLLRSGDKQKMQFKNTVRCYGKSKYGPMMVKVKSLKRIAFDQPPPSPND